MPNRIPVRYLGVCALFALGLAGCTEAAPAEENDSMLVMEPLRGGGGKGGGPSKCVETRDVTIAPDPVLAGATSITVNGSGFCSVGTVFVKIKEIFSCIPGGYVSGGSFSIAFPYSGWGSTAEPVVFNAGTYTAEIYEAVYVNGAWTVGSLLASKSFTVQ